MQELPKSMRIINELRMSGKLTRNEWALLDDAIVKAAMTRATTLMQRGTPKGRARTAQRIRRSQRDTSDHFDEVLASPE